MAAHALRAVAGATSKIAPGDFLRPPSVAVALRAIAGAMSKIQAIFCDHLSMAVSALRAVALARR